jgi:hypothetical protein
VYGPELLSGRIPRMFPAIPTYHSQLRRRARRGGVHPIQVAVSQPCSSPVKTSFAGYEVGHDIAVLNADSSEWRFGVLAGYVGSKIDPGSLAPILPPGTADGNSPSAGLYAAYSKGAFSADIQARR